MASSAPQRAQGRNEGDSAGACAHAAVRYPPDTRPAPDVREVPPAGEGCHGHRAAAAVTQGHRRPRRRPHGLRHRDRPHPRRPLRHPQGDQPEVPRRGARPRRREPRVALEEARDDGRRARCRARPRDRCAHIRRLCGRRHGHRGRDREARAEAGHLCGARARVQGGRGARDEHEHDQPRPHLREDAGPLAPRRRALLQPRARHAAAGDRAHRALLPAGAPPPLRLRRRHPDSTPMSHGPHAGWLVREVERIHVFFCGGMRTGQCVCPRRSHNMCLVRCPGDASFLGGPHTSAPQPTVPLCAHSPHLPRLAGVVGHATRACSIADDGARNHRTSIHTARESRAAVWCRRCWTPCTWACASRRRP